MAIKPDRWIRRMAETARMIEPFEPGQIRESENGKVISYGTSGYGYDIRCSNEFKIFTNINCNCPGTLRNNSLGIILLPEESRCDSLRL